MIKKINLLFVLLLAACQQNPYAGIETALKPQEPLVHAPPYFLDIPSHNLQFLEDEEREYEFFANVPKPGKPIVSVENLPEGAEFDPSTLILKWKPALDAANDPNDPESTSRQYETTVKLTSDADRDIVLEKDVVLTVKEKYDDLRISVDTGDLYLQEGNSKRINIEISSREYPDGPFDVYGEGFPEGVHFVQDKSDPKKWSINFRPSYDLVPESKRSQIYQVTYNVRTRSGRSASRKAKWTISHLRQHPLISAPTNITQGPNVNFLVTLEDLNGEAPPVLSWLPVPSQGSPKITQLSKDPTAHHPRASFEVEWNEIPQSLLGTEQNLTLNCCSGRACTRHVVRVKLEKVTNPQPKIDRTQWPNGTVKYGKVGVEQKVALPIVDGGSGEILTDVEILPADLASEVTWVQGELQIKPTKDGGKQFTVKATSEVGEVAEESFFIEVAPESFPEVLLLVDTKESKETRANLELFDSPSVSNPLWQALEGLHLLLRKTIVSGTYVFSKEEAVEKLEAVVEKVPNLVISSPLVSNLKRDLKAELQGYGLQFSKRFLELGFSELKEFDVIPSSELTQPQRSVKLDERLTSESNNPQTLLLENEDTCKPLLKLEHETSDEEGLVGAVCDRQNGGKLLVLGVELGDIVFKTVDEGLSKVWVQEALK